VATAAATPAQSSARTLYRPRGPDPLRKLFRQRFPAFQAAYEQRYDLFRPFSCKSFFLCSSCAQKRTLLLGEYLDDDLMLCLPHRQFVWIIPVGSSRACAAGAPKCCASSP